MAEDSLSFSNMDSWHGGSSGKSALTFKGIIIEHIRRCVINGSTEFRGGYNKEVGNNPVTVVYVPDTRDTYNNSVKMLRCLLLGYFDKQIKEEDEKLRLEFEETFKSYEEQDNKGKEVKNEWYKFKVEWHIRLFEQLILLSKRLNFFEEETSEEEI